MQARLFEFLRTHAPQVVLCENDAQADELAQITLYKGLKTFVLPDFRASFGDDLRAFSKELFEICRVLNAYHKENEKKNSHLSRANLAQQTAKQSKFKQFNA